MRNSRAGWHGWSQLSYRNSEKGNLTVGRTGQDSGYILKGRSKEALGPGGRTETPGCAAAAHVWGRALSLRWLAAPSRLGQGALSHSGRMGCQMTLFDRAIMLHSLTASWPSRQTEKGDWSKLRTRRNVVWTLLLSGLFQMICRSACRSEPHHCP